MICVEEGLYGQAMVKMIHHNDELTRGTMSKCLE